MQVHNKLLYRLDYVDTVMCFSQLAFPCHTKKGEGRGGEGRGRREGDRHSVREQNSSLKIHFTIILLSLYGRTLSRD